MAINHVTSNTLTNATIFTFNNKQSNILTGFREELGIDFSKIKYFIDGTHSPIDDPLINNKEIDIVGFNAEDKPSVLIEVKANLREQLQLSQNKTGEYITYANERHIPIYYFIPKGYVHESELPPEGKYCHIVNWDKIMKVASTYDTTFSNLIIANAENVYNYANIGLERMRARVWEILARTNIDFTFSSYELNSYSDNGTFYNYIYLNKTTFLWFSDKDFWIGKDNLNSTQGQKVIQAGFEWWPDPEKCYYYNKPIISFNDFMDSNLTDKTVEIVKDALLNFLHIEDEE